MIFVRKSALWFVGVLATVLMFMNGYSVYEFASEGNARGALGAALLFGIATFCLGLVVSPLFPGYKNNNI